MSVVARKRGRLTLAVLGMAACTAFASPAAPEAGAEYKLMASPMAVSPIGKKVEVIEFFMYHCQFCYALEPTMQAWVKKQGDNIVFKRIHMPYTGEADVEAHLYLTLEAMGRLDDMHAKVFNATHVEHVRLSKEPVLMEWIAKNGVDKAKFLEYWNSFGILSKLKRLPQTLNNYRVESVPTIVIDGRYMTSPSMLEAADSKLDQAGAFKAFPQVLDALVTKAGQTK